MAARNHSHFGFTLFEVMAAVLVLGVMYTMIAGVAIDGLRSEGATKRRLEASLLADEQLTEIELSMLSGIAPELGETEIEIENFVVRTNVVAFDATPYLGEDAEIAEAAKELFDGSGPAALRIVDLRVMWLEVDNEYEVRRTTFAYDSQVIADLAGGGSAGGGDGPTQDEINNIDVDTMFKMLQGAGAQP